MAWPSEVRDFQLARLFNWTPEEIDDADAARCDWFLKLAEVEATAKRPAPADTPTRNLPPGVRVVPAGSVPRDGDAGQEHP